MADGKTNSGPVVITRPDGWYLSGRSQAAGVAAWGTLRWAQRFPNAGAALETAQAVGGAVVLLSEATAAPAEAEDGPELGDVDQDEPLECGQCGEVDCTCGYFDDGPQDTRGIW